MVCFGAFPSTSAYWLLGRVSFNLVLYLNDSLGQIETTPADILLVAVEIAVWKLKCGDYVLVQLNVAERCRQRFSEKLVLLLVAGRLQPAASSCVALCRDG